jgi:phenylacetate-CoA ligase
MDRRAQITDLARIPERVRHALEMQHWPPERRADWVDARLSEQLAAAGIEPGRDPRARLRELAPLTRGELRERREAAGALVVERVTSGSSGRPVRAAHGPDTIGWAAAGRLRQLAWFGLEPREHAQLNVRIASRADDPLLTRSRQDPPLFWLNPYRLDAHSADELHDELLAAGGVTVAGAESSMLARWAAAAEAGRRDPRELGLRLAIAGGEMTYPEQRSAAERVFGCRVAEMYGSHELSLIATECPAGSLHVIEEAILVEILDGEVVGTLLHNRELPILRYRLGDSASFEDGLCACGSTLARLRVAVGRLEEMVRAPDGTLLHPRFLRSIYERLFGPSLLAFHTTQDAAGAFTVRLELDGPLPADAEARLAGEIGAYLGTAPAVRIAYGAAAPPAGKLRTFTYAG